MHKTACEECRSNYEEDDRYPPCEETRPGTNGGQEGHCPINAIDLLPENQEALDLWHKIKAFGSDLVFTLVDIKLTKYEAEELLYKLSLIENIINEFQNQKKE